MDNYKELRIEKLMNELTLEEKIALVSGHDFMFTNPVPRLSIPAIRMSDGPHGLRVQDPGQGSVIGNSSATSFPTAATTANSWNPELLKAMGEAMGEEARYYDIDIILGPGVNIKRNPLCGRNFEYFSEDPLLAGVLGAGEVEGIQSQGVGTSLKHFACNNEENHRFMGDSIVDERTGREIYLKPFEYVVKNVHPETVMNAYNKVNGAYCSENKWLLTDILRKEWGYDGLVMTDWGATHNRVEGIKAGNDLEMPGDTAICRKWIYDSINNGSLSIEELNERVINVLKFVKKHENRNHLDNVDWAKHHELSGKIAAESAVLLKNEGILPLAKKEKLCVIGELFEKMRYQGSGSSMINPHFLSTPKDAFLEKDVEYVYFQGYKDSDAEPSEALIQEAVSGARGFDKVILFLGLTDYEESEGGDRPNMSLSKSQLALIEALLEEKANIVVVLYGGSVVELPFYERINGLLHMFLPGQNGGKATYDLLFGEVCPSGKLAETWPLRYDDVPFFDEFGNSKQVIYKESVFVGYRYYLSANKEVRFPFGYGLSYTSFDYRNLKVENKDEEIIVEVTIENTGSRNGDEIVQVYVEAPHTRFYKPLRELKGFARLSIKPGGKEKARIVIRKEDLKRFDPKHKRFGLEKGEYRIQVGRNCQDICLEETLVLDGENLDDIYEKSVQKAYENLQFAKIDNALFEKMAGCKIPEVPKSKPITVESRFTELRQTLMGKILYKAVLGVALKDLKEAKKLPAGSERDNRIKAALALKKMLESNSILTMTMAARTSFPYNFAEGFVDLANYHLIRGIKHFAKKIEAPKLPIEEEVKQHG